MNKYTKILMVILLFCGAFLFASADRGGFGKKNKAQLNITTTTNLKNSIAFNLKSGLTYRGSFLTTQEKVGTFMVSNAIVSYKKGNTIYLIPYKQKILLPEYTQRDGYKLIIRSR